MKAKIKKKLLNYNDKTSLLLDNIAITSSALIIIAAYLVRERLKRKSK
tara:strand:- start:162 stop:305 length:144 start_codon:yes stop_codon:yes gene_type:complete